MTTSGDFTALAHRIADRAEYLEALESAVERKLEAIGCNLADFDTPDAAVSWLASGDMKNLSEMRY